MAYTGPVFRWDTFWADLEPGVGREQRGDARPVIIVSNDGVNAHLDVVTVIPVTKLEGKRRSVYPFEVLLPAGVITPRHTSIAMPQQIRTISKLRLIEPIGHIDTLDLQFQIESRLLEHLGIQFEAEGLNE